MYNHDNSSINNSNPFEKKPVPSTWWIGWSLIDIQGQCECIHSTPKWFYHGGDGKGGMYKLNGTGFSKTRTWRLFPQLELKKIGSAWLLLVELHDTADKTRFTNYGKCKIQHHFTLYTDFQLKPRQPRFLYFHFVSLQVSSNKISQRVFIPIKLHFCWLWHLSTYRKSYTMYTGSSIYPVDMIWSDR